MDKPIISKTKNTFPFQHWTVKEAPIADRIKQPIYTVSSQIFSKNLFDLCCIYNYTIYILPMPPRMLELLNLSSHVVSISRVRVLRHFRIRVAVWNIKIWTIISTNIYPCFFIIIIFSNILSIPADVEGGCARNVEYITCRSSWGVEHWSRGTGLRPDMETDFAVKNNVVLYC